MWCCPLFWIGCESGTDEALTSPQKHPFIFHLDLFLPIDCIKRQIFSTSTGIVSDRSWNLLRTISITMDMTMSIELSGIFPFDGVAISEFVGPKASIGVPALSKDQRFVACVSSPLRRIISGSLHNGSAVATLLLMVFERSP